MKISSLRMRFSKHDVGVEYERRTEFVRPISLMYFYFILPLIRVILVWLMWDKSCTHMNSFEMSAWTDENAFETILNRVAKFCWQSDCTVADEINQYNNTVVKLRGCERDPAQKVPHWNCVRPRCERVSALWWWSALFVREREIKDKRGLLLSTSCLSGWLLWVRRARSPLRSPPRATAQCFSLPSQPSSQRSPASSFATLKTTCCVGCDATTTLCSRPFHLLWRPQMCRSWSQAAPPAPGEGTLTSATCPPQPWKSPRRSVRHCCAHCA